MNLTTQAFASAARLILGALLGWATARGWLVTGPTLNTIILDVGTIGAVAWTVWEGTNQDRDPWSIALSALRDAGTVALNWAAGMGYIGSGDVVPLMAAIGTLFAYLTSVESKHLNTQLVKVLPFLLIGMLSLGMYGCSTIFSDDTGNKIGEGLTVGSGFQQAYIGFCVTGANPECDNYVADAKKASHVFTVTATDLVHTYETGGDTNLLMAQLVADAVDLQNLLNDFKSKAKIKQLDPGTIIVLLNTALQVYPQVAALIEGLKHGISNAQLDRLVQAIQDQDSQIQAS